MPPRRRRLGGGPSDRQGGAPHAEGSAPTMSAPAPSPPTGAPLPPPPPPPPQPTEPVLLYCHDCGNAVDVSDTPQPIPPSSPLLICSCCSGLLDENPPPPPEPVPYYCAACGGTVELHNPWRSRPLRFLCQRCRRGLLVEAPPPPPPMPHYCAACGSTVDLHSPPTPPLRVLCPRCCGGFLEENPPPPPPPPPLFPGSSSSDEHSDDDIDLLSTDYDAARAFISRFVNQGPDDGPLLGNFAAVAAMAALRDNPNRPAIGAAFNTIVQRQLGFPPEAPSASEGGEPPASAATIAALPTVEVADPAAACAICKDDLPLASQARKLPCAHLYHSTCIVTWLEMHNSCPVCRFRIPSAAIAEDQDSPTTRITIRFTTSTRRRSRVRGGAGVSAAPISASPTQLAQAVTGSAAGGPANSGETVSSEWPQHSESDAVMSEAREGDEDFFD